MPGGYPGIFSSAEHAFSQRCNAPSPSGCPVIPAFQLRPLENILPVYFSKYAVIYGIIMGIIRERRSVFIPDRVPGSLPPATLRLAEPPRFNNRKSPYRITPAPIAAPATAKGCFFTVPPTELKVREASRATDCFRFPKDRASSNSVRRRSSSVIGLRLSTVHHLRCRRGLQDDLF